MVAVFDGGPGQEDPDSMGQLLVQKKNVVFEADGKVTTEALASPISSESFIFRATVFLHPRTFRDLLHQRLRK